MSRKTARDILFKFVFETLFLKQTDISSYEKFLVNNEFDEENLQFVKENYENLISHSEDLTEIISKNLNNYTIDNVFKIDLAIILMATNELLYYKKTPIKVVVNEAVEIAKKYSTSKSASFINGILAKIIVDCNLS